MSGRLVSTNRTYEKLQETLNFTTMIRNRWSLGTFMGEEGLMFDGCFSAITNEELCNKLNELEDIKEKFKVSNAPEPIEIKTEACTNTAVMCRAGDFVKEAGGNWIKVLRVEGRNIYLDYDDGLNCLDVDDVIAWKHGT